MKLTTKISTKQASLTATLDPATIAQAKLNLYELAVANGFVGSFDDFLAVMKVDLNDISSLISTDNGNALTTGTDDKLFVVEDTTDYLAHLILILN